MEYTMLDLSPCSVCGLEFTVKMATCPRCDWPRGDGEGGVREPRVPEPDTPLTGACAFS